MRKMQKQSRESLAELTLSKKRELTRRRHFGRRGDWERKKKKEGGRGIVNLIRRNKGHPQGYPWSSTEKDPGRGVWGGTR